jgi:glutaredoxin
MYIFLDQMWTDIYGKISVPSACSGPMLCLTTSDRSSWSTAAGRANNFEPGLLVTCSQQGREKKHATFPDIDGKDLNMSEKPVKIFSLSTCSHCKSTKKLMDDCTVKYEFVDVDLLDGEERKAILADVKKFNPKCSFPTVIIGDDVIVGYKEEKIKEALGL